MMNEKVASQAERLEQSRSDPIGGNDKISRPPAAVRQVYHPGRIRSHDANSGSDLDTGIARGLSEQVVQLPTQCRPEDAVIHMGPVKSPVDPGLETSWRERALVERFTLTKLVERP